VLDLLGVADLHIMIFTQLYTTSDGVKPRPSLSNYNGSADSIQHRYIIGSLVNISEIIKQVAAIKTWFTF